MAPAPATLAPAPLRRHEGRSRIDVTVKAARKLSDAGDLLGAFAIYERAVNLDPGDSGMIEAFGDFTFDYALHEEAERCYRLVRRMDPGNLGAANKLGVVLQRLGRYDEAIEILRGAIHLNQTAAELWANLGMTCHEANDFENALIFLNEAQRLKPGMSMVYAMMAEVYAALDKADEAARWSRKAAKHLPDDPRVRLNLAFNLLKGGQIREGWRAYEARLDRKIIDSGIYHYDFPTWAGAKLKGKSLLLMAEQGVGDQIMFAETLKDVSCDAGKVMVQCEDRLRPILQRSYPQIEFLQDMRVRVLGKQVRAYDWLDHTQQPDYAAPFGAVMRHYRSSIEQFGHNPGYLKPDPDRVAGFKEFLAGLPEGLKVGICWRSSVTGPKRRKFYLDVPQLEPLLTIPGTTWVKLQYDDCQEELDEIQDRFGVTVHDVPDLDQKDDIDGACALMASLDLVVTVGTAVWTFSSAVGQDTLVLVSARTWLNYGTDRLPLYPTATALFPDRFGDWDAVLPRAKAEIEKRVEAQA